MSSFYANEQLLKGILELKSRVLVEQHFNPWDRIFFTYCGSLGTTRKIDSMVLLRVPWTLLAVKAKHKSISSPSRSPGGLFGAVEKRAKKALLLLQLLSDLAPLKLLLSIFSSICFM